MSANTVKKDGDKVKATLNPGKTTSKSSKASDLDKIRQSLAKRSLNVKFDLQGSDYKPIENIGIGAYGVVCSAIHTKSGDRVAIKKIPSVFDALIIAKRTYREIKILKHFKHDNIICIREILMPKENVKAYQDIYVVFDLMESDLHRIIYSDQELSEEHIRYFLYQILRGLKYIHSANVVHRDLKPSNVLVNEDCHLRIGDFGMARGIFYTPDEPSYYMTQYVATRWYRAPEILLSMLEYGTAVDMWSVGCIFAEMIGRKHLFPGKDYMSQVKLILGVLGTPSEAVMKNCQNDILKRIIKSFGKKEPMAWDKLFPKASKKSIDLLSKMLVLNPEVRIPVEKALSHRLLNNYHDPDDEPICVPTFNFDFEKEEMDKPSLREAIMHEITDFHQPRQPSLSFSAFLRPAPKLEKSEDKHEDVIVSSDSPTSQPKGASKADSVTETRASGSYQTQKTPNADTHKTGSKVSPVSLDVGRLQVVAPSADIEMLSAQSNDGRAMETQGPPELPPVKKKDVGPDGKVSEGQKAAPGEKESTGKSVTPEKPSNTISEDTKALVKQALLNATQRRQRAESQSDDVDRSKPITAQQRQKEREEKRRKKKERALEKVKKSKDKKGVQEQSISLSNQDVELLRRWTVMQNPAQRGQHSNSNSPPHPEPSSSPANHSGTNNAPGGASTGSGALQGSKQSSGTSSVKPRQILAKTSSSTLTMASSVTLSSNQMNSGGTVIISSSQIGLSQSNFIPVIAIPSAVNPGKLEIKRIYRSEEVTPQAGMSGGNTSSFSSSQASDSTKAMLQNAILLRSQAEAGAGNSNQRSDPVKPLGSFLHQIDTKEKVSSVNSSGAPSFPFLHQIDTKEEVSSVNSSGAPSFPSQATSKGLPEVSQLSAIPSHMLPASSTGAGSSSHLHSEPQQDVSSEEKFTPNGQGNDLSDFLDRHIKEEAENMEKLGGKSFGASSFDPYSHHMSGDGQTNIFKSENESPSSENLQINLSPPHPPPSYSSFPQVLQPPQQHGTGAHLPQGTGESHGRPNHSGDASHNTDALPFSVYGDQLLSNSFPTHGSYGGNFHQANNSTNNTFNNHPPNFLTGENFSEYPSRGADLNFAGSDPHPQSNMLFPSTSEFSPQASQIQQQRHQHHQQMFPSTSSSFQTPQNFGGSGPSFQIPSSSSVALGPCASNFNNNNSYHQQRQTHQHNIPMSAGNPVSSSLGNSGGQQAQLFHHQPHGHMVGPSASYGNQHQPLPGPSNVSRGLTVNCNKPGRTADSPADLIALLSKQFSKSQVVDVFPPTLALTPKGTGAGYGVGMDLETMLTDAQDNNACVRVEQSPLSSSLLADWLDVSSSLSQADLEALERELQLQSPMNISYSDVNL
ncbi:mitogen-activated protein kinase 7 [Aplysia californica]|uniref:Mitogen-activated protein kinase n=1 Tax=Aplysia californica TaxID=6500 RepID=A0ABM0JCB2_APLCA|nr:mitogen-activated protein kinase 7 [Aplysia californica]